MMNKIGLTLRFFVGYLTILGTMCIISPATAKATALQCLELFQQKLPEGVAPALFDTQEKNARAAAYLHNNPDYKPISAKDFYGRVRQIVAQAEQQGVEFFMLNLRTDDFAALATHKFVILNPFIFLLGSQSMKLESVSHELEHVVTNTTRDTLRGISYSAGSRVPVTLELQKDSLESVFRAYFKPGTRLRFDEWEVRLKVLEELKRNIFGPVIRHFSADETMVPRVTLEAQAIKSEEIHIVQSALDILNGQNSQYHPRIFSSETEVIRVDFLSVAGENYFSLEFNFITNGYKLSGPEQKALVIQLLQKRFEALTR